VSGEPEVGADLTGVDTWIFDLDNTLYPADGAFMAQIEGRMSAYVARLTGLPADEAYVLQRRYLDEHGTTLAGLMANHGVDPRHFLDEVHDVPLDMLEPDPELKAALKRLPGRRLVFTNGHSTHAFRVLEKLALADLFDQVFHLETANLIPKPRQETFDALVALHAIAPGNAAFFEDTERNLAPAAGMGMTTILVGPHALTSTAPFVHHRTTSLTPFLLAARLRQDTP
jgi:putative hydrolase of the HAD superfamily